MRRSQVQLPLQPLALTLAVGGEGGGHGCYCVIGDFVDREFCVSGLEAKPSGYRGIPSFCEGVKVHMEEAAH